jgi:hypothetical protein
MCTAIERIKPRASRGVQLLLAAATWTFVGTGLLIAGLRWSLRSEPDLAAMLVVLAVLAGLLKVAFALRPAARRVADRIERRGDGRCVGGFFSWRTWLFVALMILSVQGLRRVGMPLPVLGVIYVAVGVALLIASWWLWRAWAGCRSADASR